MADSRNIENKKLLQNFLKLPNDASHKFRNKTANINMKNCSLSIALTATDQKPQSSSLMKSSCETRQRKLSNRPPSQQTEQFK